jgi:hypothetical protein
VNSRQVRRFIRNGAANILSLLDSLWVGHIAVIISQSPVMRRFSGQSLRRLVDLAQPINPLGRGREELPAISLVTVTSSDTFEFTNVSLSAAIATSHNPISECIAIVPEHLVPEARTKIPVAKIVSEREILPERLFASLERYSPSGRKHWVLCQVLGMYFARHSQQPGVLIVDADTYLLRDRTWLTEDGRQLLSFSREYHEPYEQHCVRLYGPRRTHHGLSYVTHYQLMQPGILAELFPDDDAFLRWIESGDASQRSAVGDYHTYGRWLTDHYPKKVALARWKNVGFVWDYPQGVGSEEVIANLRERFPDALSVSSHRYLENRTPKSGLPGANAR